jgi:hypothetical protein
MSSDNARIQVALDDVNIDHGYCNPIKAKIAEETEKEVIENLRKNQNE